MKVNFETNSELDSLVSDRTSPQMRPAIAKMYAEVRFGWQRQF